LDSKEYSAKMVGDFHLETASRRNKTFYHQRLICQQS
jgi:hypothetical protein